MLPAFQLHLRQRILDRVAQVGKFDGKHPSLVCGTSAGKVFLHSPHEANHENSDDSVRFLKINRKISALATGKFQESDAGDTLVVGTQASLLAYNVEKNSDIFYKDVPDGVNTVLFAPVPAMKAGAVPSQMVVVGGNCSIQGFNEEGNEIMWTVTGDNVRALTLTDVTGHGRDELVVGSDDFEIRAFQHEEIVFECTETSPIVALTPIQKNMFGYALQNGTVGVYRGKHRAWRVKSKNTPVAIHSFDINGDGEKEIVIGWSNGKMEARRLTNGEVVFKEMLSAPVAALVSADYRMDGNEEVICCTSEGEIRGYFASSGEFPAPVTNEKAIQEEKEVAKLSKYRTNLQLELKALESLAATSGTAKNGKPTGLRIRAGTRVHLKPVSSRSSTSYDLEVSTENDHVVKMVILYEHEVGIFEGETLVTRPPTMAPSVVIPLKLTKHMAAKVDVKVLVGSRGGNASFHVFETTYKLPKFAMFCNLGAAASPEPKGSVRFRTPVKTMQICSWIEEVFGLTKQLEEAPRIDVFFVSLRDSSPLNLVITPNEIVFQTDDMQLAAELVQDLCAYLEWRDLESLADFPRQMEEFKELLVRVDECNAIRLKLTGEMADDSNQIKNLVIRAEDARILNDM